MIPASHLDSAVHSHHDPFLVGLAALICLFACYTALSLLGNAGELTHARRHLWGVAASVVAGCGAWATHFVAMLAWRPELQIGYDLGLTIWSVVLSVTGSWAGIALMLNSRQGDRSAVAIAGGIAGASMSAMHYVGMAAVRIPAIIHHDRLTMAVSVAVGVGMAAAAFRHRWSGRPDSRSGNRRPGPATGGASAAPWFSPPASAACISSAWPASRLPQTRCSTWRGTSWPRPRSPSRSRR